MFAILEGMGLLAVHVLTSSARVAIQWLYTKRASRNEWTFNEVREKTEAFQVSLFAKKQT